MNKNINNYLEDYVFLLNLNEEFFEDFAREYKNEAKTLVLEKLREKRNLYE